MKKNVKTAKNLGLPFLVEEAVAEDNFYDDVPANLAKGAGKVVVESLHTIGASYLYFKLLMAGGAMASAGLSAKAVVGAALIAASLGALEHSLKKTIRVASTGDYKLICHKGNFALLERDILGNEQVRPYQKGPKTWHGKAIKRVISTNLTLFEQLAGGKVCKDPKQLSKFNKAINSFSRFLFSVNNEETQRIEEESLGVEADQ